nr:C45 family peptidase [Acetobacter sicerae]
MDPLSAGIKYGTAAKASIYKNIETTYLRLKKIGIDEETCLAEARQWADQCPADYLTEIEGLAIGSAARVEDIWLLNFRIEIAQPRQADLLARKKDTSIITEAPACTLFSIRNEDGYLQATGQNLDGLAAVENCLVVTRRLTETGETLVSIQEAGVVGPSIGVSSVGFSLVYAGLIMESCKNRRDGTPLRAFFHRLLTQKSFGAVMSSMLESPPPYAVASILNGRVENRVAVVEFLGEGVTVRHSNARIETHANHATMPSATRSLFERHLPDSLQRDKRLALLLADSDKIDTEYLKNALSDHENFPASICLHPRDKLAPIRRASTLCGAIMDWREGILHVSDGRPCHEQWRAFKIPVT